MTSLGIRDSFGDSANPSAASKNALVVYMKRNPTLEESNQVVLMLVQALLGSVSANFRMVTLDHDNEIWKVQFVLEKDSQIDREEINEIVEEFVIFQEKAEFPHEVDIRVFAGQLDWPPSSVRVVFRRKE